MFAIVLCILISVLSKVCLSSARLASSTSYKSVVFLSSKFWFGKDDSSNYQPSALFFLGQVK